jgi:hypothetical protein
LVIGDEIVESMVIESSSEIASQKFGADRAVWKVLPAGSDPAVSAAVKKTSKPHPGLLRYEPKNTFRPATV